ncbi:MAG TPA: low molecular weight protein-tyrosine-phosphatase [Actinocrinis sp.]|uniref:low molecular weight protein-tyrosine-phosphatase n=1 Tax=Actinocrinis sp. TaxID=1920516 RepID=UPI002D3C0593|nr:low molecular weight protein-tyrosine-phosphatase [Actinocrinis sp.]HZU55674.1 low molecular weight protein-tyrosine-phosphatase [Actinocrinis sp.]
MNSQQPPGPRRILTVCLGNYCRSPLAAASLTQLAGPELETRSAGLRGKWVGRPAHPWMCAAAAERGIDLRAHRGTQITQELIGWADLVLAMDRAVLAELRQFAGARYAGKLRTYLPDADVPDPFGGPYEAFRDCVARIRHGAFAYLPESDALPGVQRN